MSTTESPPDQNAALSPGDRIRAARAATREQYFGGARLLIADATAVCLLLNEARARATMRLFGVPRDDTVLVTLIALGIGTDMLHRNMSRALKPPPPPASGDLLLGAALLRAGAHAVGGESSREWAKFGTLAVLALTGAALRPALRNSSRAVKKVSSVARSDFRGRYGHIIRPSR